MDDRNFDAFTRGLALGKNRRQLLRSALGLGGAVAAATVKSADAARRPTPTPRPVSCPGVQTPCDAGCCCPADTNPCGPDCCPAGATCCDNACCYGQCYGEELCCPTGSLLCDGVCTPDIACCVDEDCGEQWSCQYGACVQTCQETSTCDCSTGANEGSGCNDGEGICENGVCVPTCEPYCSCYYWENEGLGCDGGAGTCTNGECVPDCGSISGQVTDSSTGDGISGASVSVGMQNATTDGDGYYSFACVPGGSQTVWASAGGFGSGSTTVTVTAGEDATANISLVPESTSAQITIVLTWNAIPDDLDSHLTGPDVENGGRFHVWYLNKNPVTYASLDVDDIDGNGPETVTVIEATAGAFAAGDYHYWVHNFSNGTNGVPGDFSISGATVTIYQDGAQIAQYYVGNASGSQAEYIWWVVNFSLAADGTITLNPVETMMPGSEGTVL